MSSVALCVSTTGDRQETCRLVDDEDIVFLVKSGQFQPGRWQRRPRQIELTRAESQHLERWLSHHPTVDRDLASLNR